MRGLSWAFILRAIFPACVRATAIFEVIAASSANGPAWDKNANPIRSSLYQVPIRSSLNSFRENPRQIVSKSSP